MPSEKSTRHRRRRITGRIAAVAISLLVHALLFLSLVDRPIKLGDHGGVAVDVSLMESATQTEASATTAKAQTASLVAVTPSDTKSEAETVPVAAAPDGLKPFVEALDRTPEPDATPTPTASPSAAEVVITASVAAFVAQAAAAQAGQPGESCKIAEWLTGAMRDNKEIADAVALVPRQSRSVANALMLWNGLWVEPSPAAAEGFASLKQAVLAGLQTAPPYCLQQTLRGPLLISIGEERDTLTLAIGSGEWRWADLLDETSMDAPLTSRLN